MKSIDRQDFIEIGAVLKPHGTKGELKLGLSRQIRFKKWAFLEIKGKPVPFYISHQAGSEEEPIIKFEEVTSVEDAERLAGAPVLVLSKGNKKQHSLGEDLIGYKLTDERLGHIGEVETIEEYPQQLLFKTIYNGSEVLIPAVDDFILSIDKRKKIIYLDLPEGLI